MGNSTIRKRKQSKKKNFAKDTMTQPTTEPPRGKRRLYMVGATVLAVVVFVLAAIPLWLRLGKESATATVQDATASTPSTTETVPSRYTLMGTYELLETVPHNATAFTQGFVTVEDNNGVRRIYEGTGMWGDSEFRLLDLAGNTLSQHEIPDEYFGEGIAHYPLENGYGLVQLTWKARVALEYRLPTDVLATPPPTSSFSFTTTRNEGWGITYDPVDRVFWVSDGSAYLHLWNGTDFNELDKIPVSYQMSHQSEPQPLARLNELEWDPITRTVLANVWGQDVIARIDPVTGFTTAVYDCSTLFQNRPASADVFNGIALTYDLLRETVDDKQVWVTGKYWPNTYRIRLVDPVVR